MLIEIERWLSGETGTRRILANYFSIWVTGAVTPMRTEHRFTWVLVWKLQLAGCCEARTFSTPAEVLA